MKNILLTLLAVCGMQSAFAQSTVVRGDMDGDGNVTVGDLTETVDVVLGRKAVQIISTDVDAYKVDNTLVQGTWNASDGSSVTFNADGTTSLGSGWTYKFRPVQGQISVYDAANVRQRVYNVTEIDDTHMALGEYGKNYTTFYYKGNFIKLSETKLTLVVDDTYTLSASMMPGGTASFTWTSSDSDVAMVTKASSGTVDDKTELDEADDAAYVNWGSVWRTPSEAQIEELVSNTTVTYANGGYTITSKLNGNYIVMAASDYFKKSGKYEPSAAQTYYYYYMTRSLYTNTPTNCYLLELSRYNPSSGTYTYSISKGKTNLRTYGYPVRPVLNVQP